MSPHLGPLFRTLVRGTGGATSRNTASTGSPKTAATCVTREPGKQARRRQSKTVVRPQPSNADNLVAPPARTINPSTEISSPLMSDAPSDGATPRVKRHSSYKMPAVACIDNFGPRLRALRVQKGMTQQQLATHLCIQRHAVAEIELGTSRPSLPVLLLAADYFGVTLDWFLARPGSGSVVQEEDELALLGFWRSLSFAKRRRAVQMLIAAASPNMRVVNIDHFSR